MGSGRTAVLILVGLACLPAVPISAQSGWGLRAADDTAARLLRRAVAALGGAQSMDRIQTVWVRGHHETSIYGVDSSGPFEFAARTPDALRAVVGLDLSERVRRFMVRTADGPLFWTGDINGTRYRPTRSVMNDTRRRESARRAFVIEASRYLVTWMLKAPRSVDAVASDGGRWTAGDTALDSLSIAGADGLELRLAFDAATGLPCRIGYSAPPPRPSTQRPDPHARPVNVVWELSDYRQVHRVRFPHQIVMRMDGTIFRQIVVREVQANPDLPTDFFRPQ